MLMTKNSETSLSRTGEETLRQHQYGTALFLKQKTKAKVIYTREGMVLNGKKVGRMPTQRLTLLTSRGDVRPGGEGKLPFSL
jgi:hypothetical protein